MYNLDLINKKVKLKIKKKMNCNNIFNWPERPL